MSLIDKNGSNVKKGRTMMNKKYYVLCALILLTACSTENEIFPQQVVTVAPPQPAYPVTTATAVILNKRILPHNRMEYHARMINGKEVTFTVDTPVHYQIGDTITIPVE
jgi:hypothetical protein